MEKIKIVFFILGSFFGIENSRIISEKVKVTIEPNRKTITIIQENLFSILKSEKDSLAIDIEIDEINEKNWLTELKAYSLKSFEFYADKNNILNAKIILHYTNFRDLKTYAIDVNQQGNYSIINIPEWNLKTNGGTLDGNYWNFDASKPFSFTLEVAKNIPSEYKVYKSSIHSIWEANEKK